MRTTLFLCLYALSLGCIVTAETPQQEPKNPVPEASCSQEKHIDATKPTEPILPAVQDQEAAQPNASIAVTETDNQEEETEAADLAETPEKAATQPAPEQTKPTESNPTPAKEILNEVRAVIGGPTEAVLILTQDIRPWLDGTPRTLRDLVIEKLILIDAESLKLQPTEEDVDRVILQIQKNNNYTHEKLLEMLTTIDYTMEEFREDLKHRHAIDMMLDYRVRSDKRMTVSEEEVKAWWNAHAENQFKLMTGHITTTLSKDQLEKEFKKGALTDPIDWENPFTIAESQLPEEKQFIKDKKAGEIVLIEPEEHGFEITKLISQGKEPLKSGDKEKDQKRYKDIERQLQMQRYGTVREEYEKKLLKNAKISFKYEADRKAVMGE
jgi:hypothetical protein